MNYVQPQVRFNEEVQVNEGIEWTVVAITAIIAIGGYAAYCTYRGGSFVAAYNHSEGYVYVGCQF